MNIDEKLEKMKEKVTNIFSMDVDKSTKIIFGVDILKLKRSKIRYIIKIGYFSISLNQLDRVLKLLKRYNFKLIRLYFTEETSMNLLIKEVKP